MEGRQLSPGEAGEGAPKQPHQNILWLTNTNVSVMTFAKWSKSSLSQLFLVGCQLVLALLTPSQSILLSRPVCRKSVPYSTRSVGGVHISFPWAANPYVDKPLKSVTHGQCDARSTVTFPAAGHRRPLTGTKLYCLVTEARVCEQLAQGCYLKARGRELNSRPSESK